MEGTTPTCAQRSFLVCIGDTLGGLGRPYGESRIEPKVAKYKACTLLSALSLWANFIEFLKRKTVGTFIIL